MSASRDETRASRASREARESDAPRADTADAADTTVDTRPLTSAPSCPKCGGRMWDNRLSKRNPKAPDFKCRDPRCDGVVWPDAHHAARPILARQPSQEHAPPGGADADVTDRSTRTPAPIQAPTPSPRDALRDALRVRFARYLDVTDFVLAEVRPTYEAAGVPCTDATVAAITATLFLGVCGARGPRGPEGGR